jgi:hypothetical protein
MLTHISKDIDGAEGLGGQLTGAPLTFSPVGRESSGWRCSQSSVTGMCLGPTLGDQQFCACNRLTWRPACETCNISSN